MIKESNRKWWVLSGVGIVSFLGCIDLTIVNTAAPEIGRDLGATVTELQLAVNIFVVALSMFMVTAGRLSDMYGRRRVLYLGTVLFGLASLGAGCVSDIELLMVFRFLQGAACAVLYTSSSTIVAQAFPADQRGRAIGALFAVNGFGLAVGPMLGGVIVGALNWHWIFLINVPLVLVALALCAVSLAESRGEPAPLDWPGLLSLAVGVSGLVCGFTFLDTLRTWQVAGLIAVGVLALAVFVFVERVREFPLVPFRLFGNRLFLSAVVSEFSLGFFYATALFLMPQYLDVVRYFDALTMGLMMLPTTATVAVLSPLVGRLVDRVGPRAVIIAGFTAFAASALCQSRLGDDSSLGVVVLAFVLMGIGWAAILGPSAVAALSAVPDRLAGIAVGATWTFHNLGGAIGLALGMTVFRAFADSRGGLTAAEFIEGNRAAMLLLTGTSLAALAAVAILGWRKRRADPHASGPGIDISHDNPPASCSELTMGPKV